MITIIIIIIIIIFLKEMPYSNVNDIIHTIL